MDPFAYNPAVPTAQQQRKTTSVFKAMLPRSQKNNRSSNPIASPTKSENMRPTNAAMSPKESGNSRPTTQEPRKDLPMLPLSTPNANIPLSEANYNRERTRSSPRKPVDVYDDTRDKLKGMENNPMPLGKDKKKIQKQSSSTKEEETKPKKSKSSTTLSAMFGKSKSSKSLKLDEEKQQQQQATVKDKENCTPPNSSNGPPPPIWAQFASTPIMEISSTQKIPLNDRWDIDDEMERYTPHEYSPSKGRNFYDEQPTLSRKAEPKSRPKSAYLPSSLSSASFTETISVLRKVSQRHKKTDVGRLQEQMGIDGTSSRRSSTDSRKVSNDSSDYGLTMAKRGSRVQAAVAALNGKAKEPELEVKLHVPSDPRAFDNAFEAVLESRNIEQNVREKMRALDTHIKAEFIKKNNIGSASGQNSLDPGSANSSRPNTARPHTGIQTQFDDTWPKEDTTKQAQKSESPKKLRPRSLTFTLSKGDHSPKKEKADRPNSHSRTKSASIVHSTSSSSLNAGVASFASGFLGKAPKQAVPDDFITYLRKVQKPQLVEVGRLQKLRQLLRNETVTWVDSFITLGGVTEIVGLLYRIIDIEWREEHEDTLLHHTLTCLKALFTTSLALTHLSSLHSTLFPTLLRLLFSSGDDKKGPSEFPTRSIIISLLFTYLSTSSPSSLPARARIILSYLRDPAPEDDKAPPCFIAEMSRPRPYKIWQKEISNVTKEVFWIFLHHVNVVPYPAETADPALSFSARHFPTPRPPVPAAPYVGGVEWEATTYLATHLDLLNGLLAALPTREERNSLRTELRDSGFEKVMGETLRTCKEKFYGGVHAGLGTWVGAAVEDGWAVGFVREGPRREDVRVPVKGGSPKKKVEAAPRLEVPRLDLGGPGEGGWL